MTNQINQADHAIHKIGVISDTHGLLRENMLDILRTCEAVLHGGDIHNRQVLEQLKPLPHSMQYAAMPTIHWPRNCQSLSPSNCSASKYL